MKLSVCMPCYNAENFVEQAVKSLLQIDDMEIVVVDDGSKDNSLAILSKIAATDSRVKLLRQQNHGAAEARNKAFASSVGDYVLFFDADDYLYPGSISALLDAATPDRVCVASWLKFTGQPPAAPCADPDSLEQNSSGLEWIRRRWIHGKSLTFVGSILVPRRYIERFGGWDTRLSLLDDMPFYTRIFANCPEVVCVSGARYGYRQHFLPRISTEAGKRSEESAYLAVTSAAEHLSKADDSQRTMLACAAILKAFYYAYFLANPALAKSALDLSLTYGAVTLSPPGGRLRLLLYRLFGFELSAHIHARLSKILGRTA